MIRREININKLLFLLSIFLLVSQFLVAQNSFIIRPKLFQENSQQRILAAPELSGRPKIGVVLSGGGARGLAQIGVLKILEKNHIPIDLIVGNSLGSVVGGLYASGYSIPEIESIAVHTDWVELLSFAEETKRSDLFVGQKQSQQEGYFSIRFDGLEPIIPSSISGGQRLLNFFSYLTLQALYHPNPAFDDLKIPFRAIATDLISGRRIIIDRGSLSEALRASVTVPLLYAPIERDSMFMVDGGLRSNIPVDVAKSAGCNIVIAVNSTSSMRAPSQMKAPWEVADQIMTIMMQESNKRQMELADLVITPVTGERIVSDFSGLDTLILTGEQATEKSLPELQRIVKERTNASSVLPDTNFRNVTIRFEGDLPDERIRQEAETELRSDTVSSMRIEKYLSTIYLNGNYRDVFAEVSPSSDQTIVTVHAIADDQIKSTRFTGNTLFPDSEIQKCVSSCEGKKLNDPIVRSCMEEILRLYRTRGFSLARIESLKVDRGSGILSFKVNEGNISSILYDGNNRTRDYILRREFPLDVGEVFNIDKAARGIVNIKSTGLFEYVFLDVKYENDKPIVVLKVKERSSELIRLGFHADEEHGIVSTIDIRDANFRGAWEDLDLVMRYGYRDRFARAEYTVNRIFHSYFTFNLRGYYKSRDVLTYTFAPSALAERWERNEYGRYREIKYGGSVAFGSHVTRLGDLTAGLRWEKHQIKEISGLGYSPESYRYVSVRFQSTIDTEDKFSFPTNGLFFQLSFESATKQLGSEVSFGKIGAVYENYITFLSRHTLRSKITFGFADQTLPTAEQFSLGGLNSFLGLREDDSRGRQLLLVNFEYRFGFPFKLIFDTYLKLRYDLGTISLVPEELKFSNFHHGLGVEFALDTPLGPASFGVGESFFFQKSLPNSPVAVGPLQFYFSIGPNL